MSQNFEKKYIYVDGYVGNVGTKILIETKYEELKGYFSEIYLHKVLEDIKKGGQFPSFNIIADRICDVMEIGKGGVLATLYKFCELKGVGCEYRLCDIPILQGTIEIANFFDINPYRLLTSGVHIVEVSESIVAGDYDHLLRCIGFTTKDKVKKRVDGENISYLEKIYKDELEIILGRKYE